MNGCLKGTIAELMQSGARSNPALSELLSDYARFHFVLAVVGGLFLLGAAFLGAFCLRRFKGAARTVNGTWSFEKRTYFWHGAMSMGLVLVLALIIAANVSTAVDPGTGFSGSLGLIGSPPNALERAFNSWLQSGSARVPSLVQHRIDDRLAWQRPKAIVCSVLLVLAVAFTARTWRTLIRMSRAREARRRPREVLLMLAGVLAVPSCLLLMLMVMGNTQAAVAPMSMTLFYG
jgi:hypothetical protein